MAVMIPNCEPAHTGSHGEQVLYHLLKDQLGDEFTVIHSLPWLSAAAREISGMKAVTGEIDFLIIHANLGVLAIEVKGGAHRVQGLAFVHVKSGTTTRAVEQVRASTHGFARWLGENPQLRCRIGYALAFPHSDFKGQIVSAALTDVTVDPPSTIVIDKPDIPLIGQRVVEIMAYWKNTLSAPALGPERKQAIIDTTCPSFDGTPTWASRVNWNEQIWLRMTPEQSSVVDDAVRGSRMVITGWPGTGKTLILIESARRLLREEKSVLVLTFNSLLADFIRKQAGYDQRLRVATWHSFCRSASPPPKLAGEEEVSWLDQGCLDDVQRSHERGKLASYDVLLIDEAQAFRTEWIEWLCEWHASDQLVTFCDETQVFAFEEGRISLLRLCELIGVPRPFALTTVLRSPNAVYQKLKSVKKPEYQLHMPRELEADTLEEELVVGMDESLARTLDRLAQEGAASTDIVVLNKFGWEYSSFKKAKAHFQTLSRFRGLESPIVIVCNAEEMDDAELFCAYSRATTLCIALYNAEILGVRGADCRFQASVMAVRGNVEKAEKARLTAQTGEIVRTNLSPKWFHLKSVKLGWLKEWHGWVLESKDDLSSYWIDYLVSCHPFPVYSWDDWSLRTLDRSSPTGDVTVDGAGYRRHSVRPCSDCFCVTPHRMDFASAEDKWLCALCEDSSLNPGDYPGDDILEKIKVLDSLVSTGNLKSLHVRERASIPLSLAAGTALLFSSQNATRDLGVIDTAESGRISYRAALGFVYSLACLLPSSRGINISEFADELFDRYLAPTTLTREAWKQEFARACNTLSRRKHLVRVAKGIYSPPA